MRAQLADCLRENATLSSLNLSENNISDAGATQLTEWMHVNARHASLDLRR